MTDIHTQVVGLPPSKQIGDGGIVIAVEYQDRGSGVTQQDRQLVGDQPPVQWDHDQPGSRCTVEDLDEVMVIGKQHGNPISL